jgi:hypothetical protein
VRRTEGTEKVTRGKFPFEFASYGFFPGSEAVHLDCRGGTKNGVE